MPRILTAKKLAWAWQKAREGHKMNDIAHALYVDPSTIARNLEEMYGKTKPGKEDMIPLVYEEEWI